MTIRNRQQAYWDFGIWELEKVKQVARCGWGKIFVVGYIAHTGSLKRVSSSVKMKSALIILLDSKNLSITLLVRYRAIDHQ